MALTSYSYIAGTSAKALTKAVSDSKLAIVGKPVSRDIALLQFVGEGSQDVGTVSNIQYVAGGTPDELVKNVTAVLSATLQPIGEPVLRGNALYQVMGTVTASGGGSGSNYTLPAATVTTLGGVKELANVAALAADSNAATIVTALNAIIADAKAKGMMVPDA